MNLLETYFNLEQEILNAKTREEINSVIDKVNAIEPNIMKNVKQPAGWNTLKEEHLKLEEYKALIHFAIESYLQKMPNYTKIRNVYDLIQEGKSIDSSASNQISPFLRKVNNAFGKEIHFPDQLKSLLMRETVGGFGACRARKADLEGIIVRLENYLEELTNPPQKNVTSKQPDFSINVTNNNNNSNENNLNVNIDIDFAIENVISQMEEDDAIDKELLQEAKEKLQEIKAIKDERPKTKWDKCKEIFKWLGDKTVKFGRWFLPILAQILITVKGA